MGGRYKAYPEYKDSGEDWLGDIPVDWKALQIKHLSTVKRGASPRPIDDPKFFDSEGEYAWTRIADVTASDVYLVDAPQRLSKLGSSLSVKLTPGALFLSIAGTVGKPCITAINACIHDGFVYFPDLKIPSKFLYYVFAGEQAYKGLGKFGTQLNLNTDTVGGIKIGLAEIDVLEKIVQFLDHETAKIDTLIEKQQQLIQLLKEKRQAVISHAVTKGLNPNAKMRDSGVEWLGEVPEDWEVIPIKYRCAEITDGAHISPVTDGGEKLFVSTVNLKGGKIAFEDALLTTASSFDYMVNSGCKPNAGDILFSKDGTVGVTAITPQGVDFVVASSLIIVRHDRSTVNSEFMNFMLQSEFVVEQVKGFTKGAGLPRLSIQNLLKVIGVFPPISKQVGIVKNLEEKLSRYLDLEVRASAVVKLLQERRTALISAAVTGKIDVRDWVPPTPDHRSEEAA